MFTVEQIELAHTHVKSGADFPKYIQQIKQMGVVAFETFVIDSHTKYYGHNNYQIKSQPQYKSLTISDKSSSEMFIHYLKLHQRGETDYFTFCRHCAEAGIEKWTALLDEMSCTYYDKLGNKLLIEKIPE